MYGNPNQISYADSSSGFTFDPLGWFANSPLLIIDLFEFCVQKTRSNHWRNKGLAEKRKSNFEAAICAFKRANEIYEETENYLNIANCYLQLGQYENALKNAKKAIEMASNIKEPYYLRACINIELHHYQEAINDLDHSINKLTFRFIQPPRSDEFEKRALAKIRLDHDEEAALDATHAIELNPKNISAYQTLIQAKRRLNKPHDVIKISLQAITVAPNVSLFYSEIAHAKNKLGQYKVAEKYAKEAIDRNPLNSSAFYNLIIAKIRQKKYEETLQYAPKAIKLSPDDSALLSNIAYVNNRLKQYDKAIEYASKAIQINPSNANAYYNLCNAYNRLEKYKETIRVYYSAPLALFTNEPVFLIEAREHIRKNRAPNPEAKLSENFALFKKNSKKREDVKRIEQSTQFLQRRRNSF